MSEARSTPNRPLMVPGQKWRSLDSRDDGLTVTVLRVESRRIQIQRFNKSWIRWDRFHKAYEKVVDA